MGRLKIGTPQDGVDAGKEGELQDQIAAECNRRGWIAMRSRMDLPTTRMKGEPDFIILYPGGVLLVECKTRVGKLTTDQIGFAHWASRLGHTVHLVRSFEEFLFLTKLPTKL